MKRFRLVISTSVSGQISHTPGGASSALFHSFFLLRTARSLFLLWAMMFCLAAQAQQDADAAYKKVLNERVAKIINTLGIKDSAKYKTVHAKVVNQYIQINRVHDQGKAAVTALKQQSFTKEQMDEAIRKEREKKSSQLKQLHESFITQLKEDLSEAQLDQVKDGMTYRVFPITYSAYEDMLLALTPEQKDKIYTWLKEARELAMDEGSSEDKHKVFGKYKGRINNYLSSEGYDLKKEEKGWQERLRNRRENSKM